MAVARYKTAGAVINRAARELGLPTATDPFASLDPNMRQLVEHLNTLGLGLLDAADWEHLMRTYSFTTVDAQTAYDLPSDYHKPIDETQWDTTRKLPLAGPVSRQAWAQHTATAIGGAINLEFRLTTNQILLNASGNTVAGGQVVSFDYKSRAWVRPASLGLGNGNTAGANGADEVTATGDYPLFDPLLLHYGLKYLWRCAKQFKSDTNLGDFVRALESAKGRMHGAKALSIAPPFIPRADETV